MGWDGVHLLWIAELLHWIKPRLPSGYRAYIGSVPTIAVGAPTEKPDGSVRQWHREEAQPDDVRQPYRGRRRSQKRKLPSQPLTRARPNMSRAGAA